MLSMVETLPAPLTDEGMLDVEGLANCFGDKVRQYGFADCSVSHARTVVRLVAAVATNQHGRPAARAGDLLDKDVLTSVIQRLRQSPSADRRLPMLERFVRYLHTQEIDISTAIPECEWVGNLRRPIRTRVRQPRSHFVVDIDPEKDHPQAIDFIEQLNRLNRHWQKRAKYGIRKFCSWLTSETADFSGVKPIEVDVRKVTTAHLRSYWEALQAMRAHRDDSKESNLCPGTVENRMREIRGWFGFLLKCNVISRDPAMFIKVESTKAKSSDRILSEDEIDRFLDRLMEASKTPLLDLPLFGCMFSIGLRPSEVANLRVGDVNLTDARLRVLGKGHVERFVPLSGPLLLDLERYLRSRADELEDDAPLWIGASGHPVRYEAIRLRFHWFKKLAGIGRSVGGPHVFRHFFTTSSLHAGYDLEDIQAIRGDRSPHAVDAYDHTSDEQARIALFRAMHIPLGQETDYE